MQTQNLQIVPKGVKPIIRASQSDVGRTFQLKLYDGAIEYTPPTGTTLRLDGIKPDGTAFSYTDNLTLSGSVITVTCKTQMTLIPGTVQCEIRMTKDSEDIGTINFDLMVEKSPINGTTDLSQTEVPALVTLARVEMEEAEAWAAGTKDGVPVGPDDPQYHNNAKYWSEQISGDGQEAEAWAVGTKSGVPVPSTDPQYHNNSKYYAQEAGSSATAAGTAATNASSSAQSASSSATAAGTSASNAAAAATRAEAAVVNGPYIGANGNWFVYDFTTQQYTDTNIKAQGPQGPQGIQGLPGEDGTNGTDGVGIVSITKTATQGLVDTYTVLLTNGQTYTFTVTNGQNGTGSGDMLAANYDPTQAVYNEGGIAAYVAAQLSGFSTSLSGLTDVALTSLAAGQSLIYDATAQKWVNGSISASNVNYSNTTSGLTATKVQAAIDEVAAENQTLTNKLDNEVETRAKLGAHNLSLPIVAPSSPVFGVNATVNSDGVVTLDGTATSSGGRGSLKSDAFTLKAGTYKLSKNASDSSISIRVCIQDEPNRASRIAETDSDKNDVEFTLTNDTLISTAINLDSNVVYSNGFNVKPMITLISDTSNEYAPYAKTNQELTAENQTLTNEVDTIVNDLSAKNIFDIEKWLTAVGLSYTKNGDTYTTSTGGQSYGTPFVFAEKDIDVTLSGIITNDTSDNVRFEVLNSSNEMVATIRENTTSTSGKGCKIRLNWSTAGNFSIEKPMIRPASITSDDYVPYAMTNKELAEKVKPFAYSNVKGVEFQVLNNRLLISLFTDDAKSNGLRIDFNGTDNVIQLNTITNGTYVGHNRVSFPVIT